MYNQVGWKKEKREPWWNLHLWGDSWRETGCCTQDSPPTIGRISWDIEGASGANSRVQQPVCGRQDRVRTSWILCAATLWPPEWVVCLLLCKEVGCWNVGFEEWTHEEDNCWLQRTWRNKSKVLYRDRMERFVEAQPVIQAEWHCLVAQKGQDHYCIPFPLFWPSCYHVLEEALIWAGSSAPPLSVLQFCQAQVGLHAYSHQSLLWFASPIGLIYQASWHLGTLPPGQEHVFWGSLRSRGQYEECTQRWGWNHN